MGTTLDNGIYLPDEGERNCYEGLAGNWVALDNHLGSTNIHVTINDKQAWDGHVADTTIHVTSADKQAWDGHVADSVKHVTAEDKQTWNGKADASALTAHTGDTTIHVTAADKEAWNGKADTTALTAHTGDTTIHVTAADKQTWDTVTNKANDADVMHLTGNETVGGQKTLVNLLPLKGEFLGTEASNNGRTLLYFLANRDTQNQSGIFLTKFRQNKAQGAMSDNDVAYLSFDCLENSVRTNNGLRINFLNFVNDIPQRFILWSGITERLLGVASAPWSDVSTDQINGLNPGALSMPDLTAGVDISGYLTNAGTTTPSEYMPTVDGWLVLAISSDSPAYIRVFSTGGIDTTAYSERNELGSTSGGTYTRYAALTVPCRQNDKQNIIIMPGSMGIVKAMYYPCTGNV